MSDDLANKGAEIERQVKAALWKAWMNIVVGYSVASILALLFVAGGFNKEPSVLGFILVLIACAFALISAVATVATFRSQRDVKKVSALLRENARQIRDEA